MAPRKSITARLFELLLPRVASSVGLATVLISVASLKYLP